MSHHARLLAEALRAEGVEVAEFNRARWGRDTLGAALVIARQHPRTILHLHVPMEAFGRSPVPVALAARTRMVVTVHEASMVGRVRGRLRVAPLLFAARAVIYTNPFDRDFVNRPMPWLRAKSHVVPLATNVPEGKTSSPEHGRVVGFGTIRPLHGWEQFADAARLARESHPEWRFVAIGRTAPENEAFRTRLAARSGGAIGFAGEFPLNQLGAELSRGTVAYIPFWDGISGRRTSNLAAMVHGVPVVSNPGKHTEPDLPHTIAPAATPRDAIHVIERLMTDESERTTLATLGREYAAERSWASVARQTLADYQSAAIRATSGNRPGGSPASGRPV